MTTATTSASKTNLRVFTETPIGETDLLCSLCSQTFVSLVCVAFVFEQLNVLFLTPVERHADLPRTREYLRILDRGFVRHVIRAGARVALDHVQRLGMKVSRAIEPRLIVEVAYIDDKRVAFPMRARISHPEIDHFRIGMRTAVHQQKTMDVNVFVDDEDVIIKLR